MSNIHVADLELCKELFDLSGWSETAWSWYCDEEYHDAPIRNLSEPLKVVGGVGYFTHQYSAYDLAYLIRKLPAQTVVKREYDASPELSEETPSHYRALYDTSDGLKFWQGAETPEDALCKVAIELFKHGILRRDEVQP